MSEATINVMKRTELKHRLSKEQVAYFEKAILEHMEVDAYGLTSIASLYYDTPDFRLINRSLEKPRFKEKLRLRSYGLAKENTPLFLEVKRKYDGIVYKRRTKLSQASMDEYIAHNGGLGNSQIDRELQAFLKNYGVLEPKYLIVYDRVAYFEKGGDLRITIDHNPRYRTNDLNLHTSMEGTPLLEEGEAILEVKVQNSIPLWLGEILTKGKIYQSSFSKVGTAHQKEMRKHQGLPFLSPSTQNQQRRYGYGFSI